MPSFKKKKFTEPIINKHAGNLLKDWYVFFRFKHEGKVYKFKRREGVNRIKSLEERLNAIQELREEIGFDLHNGWNPIFDPKRELEYNVFAIESSKVRRNQNDKTKHDTGKELFNKFYLKGLKDD